MEIIETLYQGDKRYIDSRSNGVGAEWGGMWFMRYWNGRDIKRTRDKS